MLATAGGQGQLLAEGGRTGRARAPWAGAWVGRPPGEVGVPWETFQAEPGEPGDGESRRLLGKVDGEDWGDGEALRQPLNLRPKAGLVHTHLVATARGGRKPQRDLLVHKTEEPVLA